MSKSVYDVVLSWISASRCCLYADTAVARRLARAARGAPAAAVGVGPHPCAGHTAGQRQRELRRVGELRGAHEGTAWWAWWRVAQARMACHGIVETADAAALEQGQEL